MTLFCVISPNSVASGAHCVKVVEGVVVKSSRSLSHLPMSFLSVTAMRTTLYIIPECKHAQTTERHLPRDAMLASNIRCMLCAGLSVRPPVCHIEMHYHAVNASW